MLVQQSQGNAVIHVQKRENKNEGTPTDYTSNSVKNFIDDNRKSSLKNRKAEVYSTGNYKKKKKENFRKKTLEKN